MSELSIQKRTVMPNLKYGFLLNVTLIVLLALICVALSIATTTFLTPLNISNLLRQSAVMAILAIGQTFVIITGGIDLSVGAIVGLSSVIVAMMLKAGYPIWPAVLITLAFGALMGAFHAFGIRRMGLPPFIMTLATLTSLRGLAFLITNGNSVSGLPSAFTEFSRGSFLGVPSLFWVVIAVAVPSYVLLRHSRWGRYIYAVGSNSEAARLSGISIDRTILLAYVASGMLAALAGVLTASRLSIGLAVNGEGFELQAIAATVIGGTSLFGAVGGIFGPLVGSITLTTIANGANLLNVNAFWQRIVTGLLIIAIVYLDSLRRRRS